MGSVAIVCVILNEPIAIRSGESLGGAGWFGRCPDDVALQCFSRWNERRRSPIALLGTDSP
ncbi:hypothetical protein RRSWK_04800 [Rhodopirellula sp. SWK7]|nr:hypothetical protein RRSWK_04800 [Rhodopirellula sp. SWK7]